MNDNPTGLGVIPNGMHGLNEPGLIDYDQDILHGSTPVEVVDGGFTDEQRHKWEASLGRQNPGLDHEQHLAATPRELPSQKSYSQYNFWD